MKRFALALLALAGFAGAVHAADLPAPAAAAAPAAATDWTGFYLGIFGGYGTGTVSTDGVPPGFPASVSIAGGLVGVDGGYDWQTGQFVFGLEGDAAWDGMSGSLTSVNCTGTCTEQSNWLATLRGRLGVAVNNLLFYGTAGVAALNETSGTVPPNVGSTGTFSSTYTGYAVGAGLEVAATDKLTLKAEYNYDSFGTITAPAGSISTIPNTVQPVIQLVKLGANWRF